MRIGGRFKQLPITLALLMSCASNTLSAERFDVNDISYLWPVPTTEDDVDQLISADIVVADGESLWPDPVFQSVLSAATSLGTQTPTGRTAKIQFGGFEEDFKKLHTWRLAAFRVDGSAR